MADPEVDDKPEFPIRLIFAVTLSILAISSLAGVIWLSVFDHPIPDQLWGVFILVVGVLAGSFRPD